MKVNVQFLWKKGLGSRQSSNIGISAAQLRAQGQQVANTTRQTTDLYDDNGIARFTLQGWPMAGRYIGTFEPQEAR